MAKRVCKQCGAALNEGVRFCTSCGAKAHLAETAGVFAPETRPFNAVTAGKANDAPSSVTEELPSRKTPSSYDTEEMPLPVGAAPTEEKATAVGADPRITHPQSAPSSGGRKGVSLAVALGVVVLAAGAFFFFNSRGSSETQAMNQTAEQAEPSATAQPNAAPSVSPSITAADQIQPAVVEEPKSRADGNSDKVSKPPQPRGDVAAAPAPAQENKNSSGTGAAEHNLNQGIAHLGAGRYQDALKEFEYVKNLDPGNKNVYYLIGQTYHKMNQLDRALDAYRQCTSGVYASIAQNHVRNLEKKVGKTY